MKATIKKMACAAGLLAMVSGPSLAADASDVTDAKMSPAEIVRAVEAAGYKNVRDLEFDDGRWELEATSAAGTPVDLEVDAKTGKVLHEEAD